jgi:hypothetical protein
LLSKSHARKLLVIITKENFLMANSLRRNSFSSVPIIVSHCNRCKLDIESDPQCNGRTRILCPFCGEFLIRPNLPDIQQIKQDIDVSNKIVIRNFILMCFLFRKEAKMIIFNLIQVFVHVLVEHLIV